MTKLLTLDYPLYLGDIWEQLESSIQAWDNSNTVIIVDENTKAHCLPLLNSHVKLDNISEVLIPAGERFKNLDSCQYIWQKMFEYRVDRHSLVINLGGGVIGDMGGFCASTYMRGIRFIQIPTTLLSQVDASIGGKLGIDFFGLKNSVGVFNNPEAVFIAPSFLATLPDRELRSGYAEIVKHALIKDASMWKQLPSAIPPANSNMENLITASIRIKKEIVELDPLEKGDRKLLNFGHTIGHAIESVMMEDADPWLHGEAIAAGMICESHLSLQLGLSTDRDLDEISDFIFSIFGQRKIDRQFFQLILEKTKSDKKNEDREIRCTLLTGIGKATINQTVLENQILESLEYYATLAGK
ncbi:MAG: 3-dehydroquinate synthase [Saprospiraceae bacterium]|nr:3-dehydroquinate synthase [Saprospiraceae bacterium]